MKSKSLLEELNPSKEENDKKTKLLFPYLQYEVKAKLSVIGILNLDSEYPNENAGKIGKIESFNLNKGEIDYLCLQVEPNYSFDVENLNELDILLYPIESILEDREDLGFAPIDFFEIGDDTNESYEYNSGNVHLIKTLGFMAKNKYCHDTVFLPSGVIEKFIEWNIDYKDLIGLGYAYDIREHLKNTSKDK
jgi:hypothetical protein